MPVVVIANKFYGATNTSTLVIFAEDASEANEMAGVINNSGFEKDSLQVKNADIYVAVSQKLEDDYFEYKLTQEVYENIEKLEDEALAAVASTLMSKLNQIDELTVTGDGDLLIVVIEN